MIPYPPDFFDQHKDQFLSEYCRTKELTNVRIVGTESANDSNQMNDATPSTRVTLELQRKLLPRKEILKYLCESPILVPLPPGALLSSLIASLFPP